MPKGKSKVKHPELYSSEDEEEKARRRMAPQAAPHRRGGTHRVKDADRTYTHWDNRNYRELLTAVKERRLWVKDMPKRQMAKVLAEKDRHDEMIAKRANTEAYKKRKQLEEKKQKQLEEQRRLREEKEQRARERDMSRPVAQDASGLSEDEEDESPLDGNVGVGQILSDDGDEYESSTTNTTTPSSLAPIAPAQKLRIFEWQYEDAPPDSPPLSPFSASGRIREALPELLPKKLPYAVMDVMTTKTGERLELPGRAMPEEVGPDFVPNLSEHTKDCARNGVLVEPLRNAIIERGTDWATRTQVQWWNGRMYFHLPPRKSKADLASVYAKWRKKKDTRSKAEAKKAQQRLKDQREKMLDVYRVSEYRPPICYVPSYLNYPLLDDDNEEVEPSPRNLFYIRFQNMSLPHYFFWSDPEEWEDPTTPNPAWVKTEHEPPLGKDQPLSQQNIEPESIIAAPEKHLQVKQKRTPVPHKFSVAASPPKGSKYRVALWTIERDLYHQGWANTMYVLRDKWLREGKEREWTLLISQLVREFPAGRLPTSPPVGPPPPTTSLAEKFAAVEVPSSQRPVEPIQGDEHWTRDDAAYWVTVDVPDQNPDQDELVGSPGTPREPQALDRRRSSVFAWMDNLSSPSSPLRVPAQTSPQSDTPSMRRVERKAWEERFMQHVEKDTALVSTIDSMPVAELKHNLFNLMNERRRSSFDEVPGRCAFCLTSLNGLSFDEWRAHYETHANSANEVCPFCGMGWAGWTSEMRAAHIFCHDVDEGVGRNTRRKSSGISSGINALAAIPKTKREASGSGSGSGRGKEKVAETRPRKLSKVHFSPITVERRIGYNDFGDGDAGVDADVSSIATVSPRRSSLRSPIALTEAPRKSALKIDTSPNSCRNTRKPSDLTFLDQVAFLSPSMADERPIKRRKTKDPKTKITEKALRELTLIDDVKGPRRDSTVSNVSSASDARRHTALERPGPDVVDKPKGMKKDTIASKSSKASSLGSRVLKQRKTSSAFSKALNKRSSSGSDYIAFVNDHLLEDHNSDVMTGNPFAAPTKTKSKTTRGKARTVSKAKEPGSSASYSPKKKDPKTRKVPTSVKTALESKKNAAAAELKASRTTTATEKMTTILGRPFVEPLVIAPTRRYSKSCSTPSTSASSTNSIADFLDPLTSSPSKALSPKTVRKSKEKSVSSKVSKEGKANPTESWNASCRGRRPSGRPSISSAASSKSKGKVKTSALPIDVGAAKRKASYDIPFSDARPIVPPNTPATRLLGGSEYDETDEDSNGTSLDVGQLSDKISKVQTTRRGQVRELSVTAIESVVSGGKARGRSIRKLADQEEGKSSGGAKKGVLVSDKSLKNKTKTVVKKGVKLAKPAGVKKAAAKPQSRLTRKGKTNVEKLMEGLGSRKRKGPTKATGRREMAKRL